MLATLLTALLIGSTGTGEREVLVAQSTSEPPIAAAATSGKPTLELDPPQVMVAPGAPFRLKAKTNATKVFFDTEGIGSVPDDWPLGDKKLCFYGIAPGANGTHTITVTVFLGEERLIRKVLVFVGQNPLPPGPGPGPAPVDPFTAELQPLFTADKGTREQAATLIKVYLSAAEQVVGNPKFKTMREFTEAMKAVAEEYPQSLTDDILKQIRTKLAGELTQACGPGTTELGPPKSDCRKKAADLLNKYARALAGVK